MDLQDTLLVELARELEEREFWFGEPVAQSCVYLFQALVEPEVGFDFFWYDGGPCSRDLIDCLEYARGEGWLAFNSEEDHYSPAYQSTELGRNFREPSFEELFRTQLSHLLDTVLQEPDLAAQLARVHFLSERYGPEGRARLQDICGKSAASWDESLSCLERLKSSRCRPRVTA